MHPARLPLGRVPGAASVALLVAFALVAGCSSGPANGLVGTKWSVSSIDGVATDATQAPTIEFDADGAVSGTTGCNHYSGTVSIGDGTVEFGSMASSLIGCDETIGAQEGAFLSALDGARSWTIGPDGRLTISGGGDIVAEPVTSGA